MTPGQTTLEALQRWMLSTITNPAHLPADDANKLLLPSQQQSSVERLEVYHHAYFARLLEVLRELFPCTRFAVGDELFDQFAVNYLERYPPNSYTLARLADKLVEYLDATRPTDWGGFIVDLVRLEEAIDRIFDGPGPERLPPFELPPVEASNLCLTFVPGFELLAFGFPTSTFFTDWKAGREPTWPPAEAQFVALFRRDYIVRRHEMTGVQFKLLKALQDGEALPAAIETAIADFAKVPSADDLRNWFSHWAQQGFFAAASV